MKPPKKYSFLKTALLHPAIISIGKRLEMRHFSKPPLLILGAPRSGTTLLLSLLSAHPQIFAIPRQTYAFDEWLETGSGYRPARPDRLYREFLIHRIPAAASRWLEKTPKHVQNIGPIEEYFGQQVLIIHIVRDGRDVVTSSHPAYTDRRKYWVPVERWYKDVQSGLQAAREWQNILMIRYEDLVNDYKSALSRICRFISEEYVPELDAWMDKTRIKESKHWGDKVQPVHTQAVGRWQKPEHAERMTEFFNYPGTIDLLRELGYNTAGHEQL